MASFQAAVAICGVSAREVTANIFDLNIFATFDISGDLHLSGINRLNSSKKLLATEKSFRDMVEALFDLGGLSKSSAIRPEPTKPVEHLPVRSFRFRIATTQLLTRLVKTGFSPKYCANVQRIKVRFGTLPKVLENVDDQGRAVISTAPPGTTEIRSS
jgi:hypothetical protein